MRLQGEVVTSNIYSQGHIDTSSVHMEIPFSAPVHHTQDGTACLGMLHVILKHSTDPRSTYSPGKKIMEYINSFEESYTGVSTGTKWKKTYYINNTEFTVK